MDSNMFHRLPQEMITMVALDVRQAEFHNLGLNKTRWKAPLTAMLVCKSWYETIKAESRFWRQVRVTGETSTETLETFILRSGVMPLELWVDTDGMANTSALTFLEPHRHRWETLVLGNDDDGHPTAISNDFVKNWVLGELPHLKNLHIGGVSLGLAEDGRPTNLTLPQLEVLSFWATVPRFHVPHSPRLRKLGIRDSMISLTKLLRYLSDGATSLRSFSASNTLVTDLGTRAGEWETIDMPVLEEVCIRADGYDGLAQDLLRNVRCTSLRSFTYRAPNDHQTAWTPVVIDLPLLQTLDFRGHVLPPEAFRNILDGSPSLRRLVLPEIQTEERAKEAVDILVQYGLEGDRVVRDVVDNGFEPSQLRRMVEALPSIRRIDVTDGGFASWEAYEDEGERSAMKWLQENVEEILGLEELN